VTAPTGHPSRGRWTTRRALIAHGVLVVWIPGCALATWWQVTIALGGDGLGWVYSVMWPCFALFSVVLWWNIVHDDPETVGARGLRRLQQEGATEGHEAGTVADDPITAAEAEDAELAAYNAYLAQLRAGSDTKTWRRR
jgi:hypothetical protein